MQWVDSLAKHKDQEPKDTARQRLSKQQGSSSASISAAH